MKKIANFFCGVFNIFCIKEEVIKPEGFLPKEITCIDLRFEDTGEGN
jgi:hypothetical protein